MQLPGVIIMCKCTPSITMDDCIISHRYTAAVDPQTSYLPLKWTEVSGGIGQFDPNLVGGAPAAIFLFAWLYSILQDKSIIIQVGPVDSNCASSAGCQSFLLTGELKTIAPTPYKLVEAAKTNTFILKDMPAYQI